MNRHPEFNQQRFLSTLADLIALGPRLQNAASAGLTPCEGLAADVVIRVLRPHLERGLLRVQRVAARGYDDRPNLIFTVPGAGPRHLGLVGAHFDVVLADAGRDGWDRDPFRLGVEDGTLYGRGVTDCLGHVALLTELLAAVAETGQRPQRSLTVVLIANEESSPVSGIGMDYVVASRHLESLRGSPLIWLDSADFGPTVGTGGVAHWRLEVAGVAGHSGMPHNCVNAIELAMSATLHLKQRFAELVPPHPDEERYGFVTSSSFKPTLMDVPNRAVSSIPGSARVEGEIRLTPFYDVEAVRQALDHEAADLAREVASGEMPPGSPRVCTATGRRGSIALEWIGNATEGFACRLDSPTLQALEGAIRRVRGSVGRQSMTGALPLVRELQREGFDIQITGFGQGEYYHATNEQARLADFADGFAVLTDVIATLT